MLDTNNIILKRNVFWSMLENELPIPLESQRIYEALMGHPLEVGGRHDIKLLIEGEMYNAHFRNEGFNRATFTHDNIIMLSYGVAVKRKLKEIFAYSYAKLIEMREREEAKQLLLGVSRRIVVGEIENPKEYVVLCATTDADVFSLECITCNDSDKARIEIKGISEELFENENFVRVDTSAAVKYSNATHKVRQLDRSIGDSLKKLYDYRCQMTGERVGDQYQALVVEAHHLIPFTQSMNNDTSNIIILSPSYHRIIHKANPIWDPSTLSFHFPNGLIEKVKINKHL